MQVAPANFYSAENGFGFEPGANVVAETNCVSSAQPFYFSVKLPEGNYQVTAVLGGTPVLVTSMERKNGVEQDTLAGYPDAVREVAKKENCALIDLNAMSRIFYRALGANLGKAFQDGTHHNNHGSYELAKCVALGILQGKLPLAKFLVDDFNFNPAKPDDVNKFEMPASPNVSKDKPLGN